MIEYIIFSNIIYTCDLEIIVVASMTYITHCWALTPIYYYELLL